MHYKYLQATGNLNYPMTNDYMFRMVLQRDEETLLNLICSLLHLTREQIVEAYIDNPVTPGESMSEKEYQMDIVVVLNGNVIINLEMQVMNYGNWPYRSLAYLSRKYNNIARGKDYSTVMPVYHIGFLDFTLFEDHPEFFAKYQMRNAKDNYLYTDTFSLYVIELNHTNLATEEDKIYGIDKWAKLFKATTWEEIKMITKDNPSLNSTAEAIYVSNADEYIREECRLREDRLAHEKYQKEKIESLTAEIESLTSENNTLTSEISRLKKLLEEQGIKK